MTDPYENHPRIGPDMGMLPRPEGMSRPVHRKLYRFACRYHQAEPQFARPTDRKQARKLRNQVLRNRHDPAPRGKHNRSPKAAYVRLYPLLDRV